MARREDELDGDRQQHADTGHQEAGVPAIAFGHGARDDARQQCTDVDAHVEDGEGTITAVIALLIEVADHRGDVGLEQAVADDQQAEADIQQHLGVEAAHGRRHGEHELPGRHDQTPDQDRTAGAQPVVGQRSAEHRRDVHQAREDAVQLQGVALIPAQTATGDGIGEIEHQQGTHGVIGEAFPQFRGEQQIESGRMPEQLTAVGSGRGVCGHGTSKEVSAEAAQPG